MKTCVYLLLSFSTALATAEEPNSMPTPPAFVLAPHAKLWLEGNSTLHKYKADATELSVQMAADPSATALTLEGLVSGGGIKTLVVKVPVQKLKSGESGLDDNMYKSLKADVQPVIVFRMLSYKAAKSSEGKNIPLVIHGRLEVAGVSHDIDIDAVASDATASFHVKGSVEVRMSDYHVKAPVIALVIKTADEVVLKFDLDFLWSRVAAPND